MTETAQGEGRRCKGSSKQEEGCSKNEAREALETEQTQDTQLPCSWATCRCKGRARTGSSVDNAASRSAVPVGAAVLAGAAVPAGAAVAEDLAEPTTPSEGGLSSSVAAEARKTATEKVETNGLERCAKQDL